MFTVHLHSPEQLREAADRLREADANLPRELRYLLARTVRPLMKEQKRAVNALHGDNGQGKNDIDLRKTVARGLKLTLRTGRGRRGRGPAFRIKTTVPNRGLAMLPRGLDTDFDGWRSPFFGDRHNWVHHHAQGDSWFMGPAQNEKPRIRQNVVDLLQSTADEIARAAKNARAKGV